MQFLIFSNLEGSHEEPDEQVGMCEVAHMAWEKGNPFM